MSNEVRVSKPHSLELVGRKRVSMTGVIEVIGIADSQITLDTTDGGLQLMGKGIRVAKFVREDGVLVLEGEFSSLKYIGTQSSSGGFFTKLFK